VDYPSLKAILSECSANYQLSTDRKIIGRLINKNGRPIEKELGLRKKADAKPYQYRGDTREIRLHRGR